MIKKAVKTVPELNGSPISFTKKTSKYPNNLSVDGYLWYLWLLWK